MNKKAAASKNRQARISFTNVRLRPSDWVIIPLAISVVFVAWSIIANPTNLWNALMSAGLSNVLFNPSFAMLAVAIFSALYIYQDTRRKDVGVHARRIAYILSAIVVILAVTSAIAMISSGTTPTCTGLFATRITCAESAQFTAALLLMNPYSILIWGFLSLVGAFMLLSKIKPSSK